MYSLSRWSVIQFSNVVLAYIATMIGDFMEDFEGLSMGDSMPSCVAGHAARSDACTSTG